MSSFNSCADGVVGMGLTEQLRLEHEEFRRRLADWDDLIAELESGVGTFAALRLKEEAQWVRDEVMTHLDREEEIAFPALQQRAPEMAERLQPFRDDHAQLRQLAGQIFEVAWKRQLGAATSQQAQTLLKTFRWRLLDHLAREEGSLPPLVMQYLTVDDERLSQRWREFRPREVEPKGSLTDLNGRIHAWLDELLLRHLESLTALDLPSARELWLRFSDALLKHARAEDEVALPVYERLGEFPEGGHPSLFFAEHKGIERMLKSLTNRLESLSPADPSLRRKVLVSLDKYMLFRHLIEHHTLREQNILYPLLDEKASGAEKESIAKALSEAQRASEKR